MLILKLTLKLASKKLER